MAHSFWYTDKGRICWFWSFSQELLTLRKINCICCIIFQKMNREEADRSDGGEKREVVRVLRIEREKPRKKREQHS